MAEEALARFAREVTAGVPELELRLEARAEILARLEAAAALLATEGVNAEDGAARAIAEQGDPSALAAEFSARYRKRLRPRKLARLLSGPVLLWALPCFFVVAFLLFGTSSGCLLLQENGSYVIPLRYDFQIVRLKATCPLLFDYAHGAQHLRERWQAQPENIAYLGNYAERAESWYQPAPIPTLEADLQSYRAHDADNAQADYLLAHHLLSSALGLRSIYKNNQPTDAFTGSSMQFLQIKDRPQCERAIGYLLEGMRKPALRHYTRELMREANRYLPPESRYDEYRGNQELLSNKIYFILVPYRDLIQQSAYYAHQLVHEGHPAAALPYLQCWRVLCRQLISADSENTYSLDSLSMIAKDGARMSAFVYREMGREELARQDEVDAKRFTEVLAPYKMFGGLSGESTTTDVELDGGRLAQRALAPFSNALPIPITRAELTPARNIQRLLFQENELGQSLFIFSVLLLTIAIMQICWAALATHESLPALRLVIPAKVWALITAVGVLLPLASYCCYLHFPSVKRLLDTLTSRLPYYPSPQLVLALLLVTLQLLIGGNWIRRRCIALRYTVPFRSAHWRDIGHTFMTLLMSALIFTDLFRLVVLYNQDQVLICSGSLLIVSGYFFRSHRFNWLLGCAIGLWLGASLSWFEMDSLSLILLLIAGITLLFSSRLDWQPLVMAMLSGIVTAAVFYLINLVFLHILRVYSDDTPSYFTLACLFGLPVYIIGLRKLLRRFPPRTYTPEPYAAYHATMARSLLPVLTVSALLSLAIAVPYLFQQEIYWLRRDTVLFSHGAAYHSPVYLRQLAEVKRRLLVVSDGWDHPTAVIPRGE